MRASRFAVRSSAVEIMDDLECAGEVVHQTLRELEFINRTLGGNAITLNGVSSLLKGKNISTLEVLDLGCGGGDMLVLLKKRLIQTCPSLMLHGVDANPNIIQYAEMHCANSNIRFSKINIFADEFKRVKCDVAVATLFFHHFTHEQLVAILGQLKSQCRVGIVINDLHRNPIAYYSIKILTQLFSKSAMVKFDAPLSVLRGFKKSEWVDILQEAGITHYSINWKWAFRWKIIINC